MLLERDNCCWVPAPPNGVGNQVVCGVYRHFTPDGVRKLDVVHLIQFFTYRPGQTLRAFVVPLEQK